MLTVVIPSYEDAHCLELTLRSLTRQTLPVNLFEVVVVRDGPMDGYDSIVEHARGIDLRVETLPRREGRAAARNAGLAVARGQNVLFLDSDCYAHPGLLARHHEFHNGQSTDRVLLGSRYEIDWPHLGFLLRDEPIPVDLLARLEYRDVKFVGVPDGAIAGCLETPWLFAHTNNASVPTDTLNAIGGLNAEFGTRWGWEDFELFYRVHLHLGRDASSFSYDPEAICYHLLQQRDQSRQYMEFFENEAVVKRLHPNLDWEFHTLRLPFNVSLKVRYYRRVIDSCLKAGACRLAPVWSWVEPRMAARGQRVLWVGTGTGEVPIRDDALTFDYQAPASATNYHLIGTAIPVADASLDAVVSIDFWRCLQWDDLCSFLREATRVAPLALLVHTATADVPHRAMATAAEMDYLSRALAAKFDLTVERRGEISGITVRRRAGA